MRFHISSGVNSITTIRLLASGLCICFGLSAHAIQADVAVTQFQTPEKAYIEIFTYILGSSVKTTATDSLQQASVNVTYFIAIDSQIIAGDKYNLVSAGKGTIEDFMDLRRMALNPGIYTFTIEFTDNNDTSNTETLSRTFEISKTLPGLAQSDILLLSRIEPAKGEGAWVRNGYLMTPIPYGWYRDAFNTLYFYTEVYHSDVVPATDYYAEYSIHPKGDSANVLVKGYKRMKPKPVGSIVQPIDITGLTSGKYILSVRIFDQSRKQLSVSDAEFIRSNPSADQQFVANSGAYFSESFTQGIDTDSLRYALKALAPKISQLQIPVLNYLLEKGTLENQRRFLHQYWTEINPTSPELAYRDYMELAYAVDKQYHSAFGYGFETDRGHILLKYGIPDDRISVEDEPSAPPYEIWFYTAFPATNQTDVRFLFYNPSLAGGDYKLLHSTALGEIQNPRWQLVLYGDAISETQGGDFINGADVQDNFHRRAVEYFND